MKPVNVNKEIKKDTDFEPLRLFLKGIAEIFIALCLQAFAICL